MAVVKPPNLTINFEGAWKELKEYCKTTMYIDNKYMEELEKKHKNLITIKSLRDSEMVDDCIKKTIEARMETIYLKKELRELKAYHNRDNEYSEKSDEIIGKIIDKIYKYNTRYDILSPRSHIHMSPCDIYVVETLEELRLTLPHIRKMVGRNVKGIIRIDEKKRKSERKLFKVHLVTITKDALEFTFDWEVTGKKLEYLEEQFDKRKDISWHGLKMRIVELVISYGEGIENVQRRS